MATKFWSSTSASSWTTAGNWSDAVAPVSGDTVYLNHLGIGAITGGLATGIGSGAGAESLTLYIEQGYTGTIGSVTAGAATYLSFSATLETLDCHIGLKNAQGSATGSTQLLIDAGNVTTANFYIHDSGATGAEVSYPPILIKGGTTLNLYMFGGSVGVAARPGETTTLALCRMSASDATVAPNLLIGPGVTVTTLEASAGNILNRSNNTTSNLNLSGTTTYENTGTGAHTTVGCDDSSVFTFRGKGTGTQITTLNLSGTFKRRSSQAITIATANLYEGATFDLDNGVTSGATTTVTTKALQHAGMNDVTIKTPKGIYA